MRPRLYEKEILVVLSLLEKAEQEARQKLEDIEEEIELLSWLEGDLRRKVLHCSPHIFLKGYKYVKARHRWLVRVEWQRVYNEVGAYSKLTRHFQNMLKGKRGRVADLHYLRYDFDLSQVLKNMHHKNEKTTIPHITT